MKNGITTLAALRSFYDNGDDLLGVFSNLVLAVLSTEKRSIEDVQTLVNDNHQIIIPLNVLQTITKRLRKSSFVEYEELKNISIKSIYLTEQGKIEKQKIINSLNDAEREKNALIASIESFCKNEFDKNQVEENLNIFIDKNHYDATLILEKKDREYLEIESGLQTKIAEYFVKAEESEPENFNRLKSILLGKIISTALLQRNFDKNAKFEKLDVYLDTNIVFSLMEFHEDSYNKPTKEMIELIKELGFTLKIFSFTKKEVIAKLSGYLKNHGRYSSFIPIDSIYSVLKRKGITKSDIILFINHIDEKLSKLGVEVDYSFTIDSLLAEDSGELNKLDQHKGGKPTPSVRHDMAAIFAVKKLRNKQSYHLLEKSKYIFLTADSYLSAFNYREHKDQCTVPEIIYRDELTSILWLKNQKNGDKTFIHNFLISHTRENLIKNSLWEKFTSALEAEKEKGTISDEEIEEIISWEETEKILKENKEEGIKIIIDDKKIKMKKEESKEKEEMLQTRAEENKELTEMLSKKQNDNNELEKGLDDQTNRLIKISEAIEDQCRKKCFNKINYILWALLGIYLAVVILVHIKLSITIWNLVLILPILIFIELRFEKNIIPSKFKELIPDGCNFPKIRKNLQNKLIAKCISNRKKEISLDE